MPQYDPEPMRCRTKRQSDTDIGLMLSDDSDPPVMTPELARVLATIIRRIHNDMTDRHAA